MLLDPFCPCGNQALYTHCCAPYLTGKALAPTAAVLMRSRYTAYSKGNVDYLIATWHPKAGKTRDRASLLRNCQATRWLGLTLVKTQQGQPQDQRGIVEFVALYQTIQRPDSKPVGATHQLHERSRFVQEKGQWFYVDGDPLPAINLGAL
jgi:SEC-C motif domain protein